MFEVPSQVRKSKNLHIQIGAATKKQIFEICLLGAKECLEILCADFDNRDPNYNKIESAMFIYIFCLE